jgi:hypothetical protein
MQELQKSTMINSQAIQEVKNATTVNTQAIAKIESQIGQIANHLGEREKGKFPSQLVPNPKALTIENSSNSVHGHEQVQSIVTLRSRRQVDNKVGQEEEDRVELQEKESSGDKGEKVEPVRAIPNIEDSPRSFVPKAPYLERLRASKKNAQFAEILEVFKQVQINIPFAIQQVSSYAKFLKDLVMVKRKNNVPKKAFLIEQVSCILQCKLPIKYKDPGCPTISCRIGTNQIERALLDMGASVNLLPYSVYL